MLVRIFTLYFITIRPSYSNKDVFFCLIEPITIGPIPFLSSLLFYYWGYCGIDVNCKNRKIKSS